MWKVFGCSGATNSSLIVQAIDRSLDPNGDGNFSDRADIINMSLGSAFSEFPGSAVLTAIDNAALVGVINVVAAGNNGDTYYSINGLGQTPNAISVAASADNGFYFQNVQVTNPPNIAGQYPAAVASFGPGLGPGGFNGSAVLASPANACVPLANAPQVAGKIALIDRGTCTLVTKVRNAQNAGAVAVIIANNTPTLPFNIGDDGTGRDIKIPSYLLSQTGGDLIRQELQAFSGVDVSLQSNNISSQPGLANTLLSSSSRGGVFNNAVKPDIAAPGVNISSAFLGSGNGTAFLAGTSMSSPHVAGVMALLKDKYPNFTTNELKELTYSMGNDGCNFAVMYPIWCDLLAQASEPP
jgi:minor extracellular serine protease Vpr